MNNDPKLRSAIDHVLTSRDLRTEGDSAAVALADVVDQFDAWDYQDDRDRWAIVDSKLLGPISLRRGQDTGTRAFPVKEPSRFWFAPTRDVRLRRDREPDLVVTGVRLLAEASSYAPDSPRWTELRLWRSGSGQFVAEQVGRSITPGERDRCRAWVCADQAEVVKRLSRGWLSRKLFAAAGIDDAERVD